MPSTLGQGLLCLRLCGAPETAEALVAEAAVHFEERRYESATELLQRAHAVDPGAPLVFGQAQAQRLGGNCGRAIDLYRQFLALETVDADARQRAELGVAECEAVATALEQAADLRDAGNLDPARRALVDAQKQTDSPEVLLARAEVELAASDCGAADKLLEAFEAAAPESTRDDALRAGVTECRAPPPPVVEPPAAVVTSPSSPTPAPADDPPRRWIQDPAGGALLGVGVAAVAVGAGLMGGARVRIRGASDRDEVGYASAYDSAQRLNTAGIATLAVGGILTVAAVVRYAVVARKLR